MPGPTHDDAAPVIDTSRPHPARMYDWFLGGKDNYPVDEELGRQLTAFGPQIPVMARMNRAFMHRAVRRLTGEGVRQFLDVGTGIPTEPNLHQVAQGIAPETRVVYCDNDPIVLAHAKALLRGTREGALAYVQADARDTEVILEKAAEVLDLDRPVAVSLIALLHFLADEDGAYELVERLVDAVAPGSYLVISHLTPDFHPEEASRKVMDLYRAGGVTMEMRRRERFARFFEGLDVLEPGIVLAEDWHPELGEPVPGQEGIVSGSYVAVARKG
ncbi:MULTISPECIES: SAM-dependent methyltransferase [Streptomyces]|uniref:SAM-dependent methyltransferase n=1 Tax=Streptomyces chilikensis TaxID=1194079 RepID=A0ABV3EZL9_9ACTN|nr:SAM-dependent methyltransferase [Streptomyces sp. MJP52]MDH6227200.1 trans-aconitate methyltransferase [Streptomyces sp. MJP52]